ncbi:MAG: hypothetical protein Q9196_002720, partial [Gyalolechia fulgens]
MDRRLIAITSCQSGKDRAGAKGRPKRDDFPAGRKPNQLSRRDFAFVTPGFVLVDETHECQNKMAGFFATLRMIESMVVQRVRKVFLTGTPFRKELEDLESIIGSIRTADWEQEGYDLYGLRARKIAAWKTSFARLKDESDPELKTIAGEVAAEAPKVFIQRANKSRRWNDTNIRKPNPHRLVDHDIRFPPTLLSALENLDATAKRVHQQAVLRR